MIASLIEKIGIFASATTRRQNRIFLTGTPAEALDFAIKVKGADVELMQAVVLRQGTPRDAYRFAKSVRGADIGKLQALVMKSKDLPLMAAFANDVPGADAEKIKGKIEKVNDLMRAQRSVVPAPQQPGVSSAG